MKLRLEAGRVEGMSRTLSLEELQRATSVSFCEQRQRRMVLTEALPIGILSVLFLEPCRV